MASCEEDDDFPLLTNGYDTQPSSDFFASKKPKTSDYRKDREEWSDTAISCLLEAYSEKFLQLDRGNLRGKDWEAVAAMVSERCEEQSKTVDQCKNKVDNLKKRYKLERHRLSNGGVSASHWLWFDKMHMIVGNSMPIKAFVSEEDSGSQQFKRNVMATQNSVGLTDATNVKSLSSPRWRRVVFKISGGALAGSGPNNIDPKVAMLIAREVATACHSGVEVAIVIGGRNFFCGESWVTATGFDRNTAYQIGDMCLGGLLIGRSLLNMQRRNCVHLCVNQKIKLLLHPYVDLGIGSTECMMATLMNSMLLQSAFEKIGIQARVQSSFIRPEAVEPYNRQQAIRHLEKGRVVIFGGAGAGIGNPLFSTDTAAALRASEIHADALIKGTNVDGMFDCNSCSDKITFEYMTFGELAATGTACIDMVAMAFCEENGIPVVVFSLLAPGNISRALLGEPVGTLIDQTGRIG